MSKSQKELFMDFQRKAIFKRFKLNRLNKKTHSIEAIETLKWLYKRLDKWNDSHLI